MARRKRELAGGREWLDQPFSVLADEYMADIKARKKPATYISVRYSLLRALKILGMRFRVAEIRKLHLARIEQSLTKAKYSSTTVKHTIAAVQGVFHWAVKHEVLDGNPLVGYEKPKAHRRTRVITPDEYGKLLAKADPNFGRVIMGRKKGTSLILASSITDESLWPRTRRGFRGCLQFFSGST